MARRMQWIAASMFAIMHVNLVLELLTHYFLWPVSIFTMACWGITYRLNETIWRCERKSAARR
jgi:hypothetical protein